jgi:hypothetical protein
MISADNLSYPLLSRNRLRMSWWLRFIPASLLQLTFLGLSITRLPSSNPFLTNLLKAVANMIFPFLTSL